MTNYLEINAEGVAVAGVWSDAHLIGVEGASVPASWIPLTAGATIGSIWDGTSWTTFNEVSLEALREERNKHLVASDWRVLSDYPHEDQIAWLLYRQDLRDITEGYVPVDSPNWPVAPLTSRQEAREAIV